LRSGHAREARGEHDDQPGHLPEDQGQQPQRHAGILSDQRSPLVSDPGPTSGTPQAFNGFEIGAIFLAVFIAQEVTQGGDSSWFEGLQLLAVSAVLALTFFRLTRIREYPTNGVQWWSAAAAAALEPRDRRR
jgi:hypothetical protein